MRILDPELLAVMASLAVGVAIGLPAGHNAFRRRRRAARECLSCGRTVVFGARTCDCSD